MARSPRHGPPEEKPLQSSQIQHGRSNQYNLWIRENLTRKVGSRSSGRTVQAQEDQSGPEEISSEDQVLII
ncbi:hypothetical protein TNIN_321371 [Trichonephila inaurata madagascariensis]|uniref:Uncharacterized protein n=1 Tax=Trichonephila inaurata madagascariensis TaxID=2747483 RepID=A0A8X6YL04_9ARAC|nr:hypothetical protein TNIN_321371 [Trichonephila inaurata madagascariensis]